MLFFPSPDCVVFQALRPFAVNVKSVCLPSKIEQRSVPLATLATRSSSNRVKTLRVSLDYVVLCNLRGLFLTSFRSSFKMVGSALRPHSVVDSASGLIEAGGFLRHHALLKMFCVRLLGHVGILYQFRERTCHRFIHHQLASNTQFD